MSTLHISKVTVAEDSPWVTRWILTGSTGERFEAYVKKSSDFSLTQRNHRYGIVPLVSSTVMTRTTFPRSDRRRKPLDRLADFASYLNDKHNITLILPEG